ncbi:hypothetical protein JF535_02705 [Microbulbifer salipaludis]|uniref:DUF4239 domain-containing protein n=1 Tax=Microbulbifer salipaludis TaxID=187980 RepID=A0ABS3E374_9GAMM|nr:hypothetical protein [Microbulbifer salipaludis]MBN8429755.1 hypothetical protein [Microbulbifer salipaludis]
MFADNFFHTVPLAAIYVFTVLFVLAALAAGLWLGSRYMRVRGLDKEPSIGSAVTATLGLLAFLLAFTFNMTADRYNKRKTLLLDEVNAIHTGYLHADFLKPAAARQAQKLLLEYAELRNFDPHRDEVAPESLAESVVIQERLWAMVREHVAAGHPGAYLRQFVEPVTQIINSHNSRIVIGLEYRIPGPIWLALYFLTALAMLAIGFQFGVSRSGSRQLAVTLSLTFATVILLIADLDRATEGVIIVDETPMAEMVLILQEAEKSR